MARCRRKFSSCGMFGSRPSKSMDGSQPIDDNIWLSKSTLEVVGLAGSLCQYNSLAEEDDEFANACHVSARQLALRTIFKTWIPLLRLSVSGLSLPLLTNLALWRGGQPCSIGGVIYGGCTWASQLHLATAYRGSPSEHYCKKECSKIN